jgi:hypothetical protein
MAVHFLITFHDEAFVVYHFLFDRIYNLFRMLACWQWFLDHMSSSPLIRDEG